MKTLLRIDASARINGSNTRILTDYFQSKWLSNNPEGKVIHRCLASNPLPHVDENFNGDIFRGLLLRHPNLDLLRVQDVGLREVDDPAILAWAADNGRILLTHDRATMPWYGVLYSLVSSKLSDSNA